VWAMLEATGARPSIRFSGLRMLRAPLVRWLGRAQRQSPFGRAMLLGGASALLPCGFLYAFALAAAATARPLSGALVMGSLWLGNLPALLGFGLAVGGVLSRLKRHIPLLSAACVFALGVSTLNSRINLPAFAVARAAAATEATAAARRPAPAPPMPADCPCHRKRRQ